MADQSIASMIMGLSQGIDNYMQLKNQTQARIDIQNNQLQNEKALADYKQQQEGTIDSNTAEKLYPGMGEAINNFHQANGRNPYVSEFNTLASVNPSSKGANTNLVGTGTLTTLLSHTGMDPDEVTSLTNDLKKQGVTSLPVGIAETYMKNSNKGVLPDASLMALAKNDPTFEAITDPDQKAEYFNNLKSAFNAGGKLEITNQQDLNTVSQAAMTTYQTALANPGKYGSDPLLATASILGKKYSKNSVHRILLNMAAQKIHSNPSLQQPQPATPSTGSTIMGAVRGLFGVGGSNPSQTPQTNLPSSSNLTQNQ